MRRATHYFFGELQQENENICVLFALWLCIFRGSERKKNAQRVRHKHSHTLFMHVFSVYISVGMVEERMKAIAAAVNSVEESIKA